MPVMPSLNQDIWETSMIFFSFAILKSVYQTSQTSFHFSSS